MPSTCIFEFDRPEPIYYSGETINGRIKLNTTKEKDCQQIYILFEGAAKVRWEEEKSRQENNKTHYYTEYYRGDEKYISTRTKVFSGGKLPPGQHVYCFSIPLPLQCPTSCVEIYGQIEYEISLVLDRAFRFDNVFQQPLTVIRQMNLNMMPELLLPIKNEDIKYFCCWPCSSGPVTSVLTIPFSGYAPGQAIKYTLEINNEASGYDLDDGVVLRLRQRYNFVASSPYYKTKTCVNVLAENEQELRCLRLSKRLIENTLLIPPVAPTSPDGIITVQYEIEMTIKTGACHVDQDIAIPIVIGTVPLAQSATNPENAIMVLPTAPVEPDTPGSDKPPGYDNIKPPSFEEASTIGGKFDDKDRDKNIHRGDFIPKYPMYTNFAAPSAPPSDMGHEGSAPLLQPPSYSQAANNEGEKANYGWKS